MCSVDARSSLSRARRRGERRIGTASHRYHVKNPDAPDFEAIQRDHPEALGAYGIEVDYVNVTARGISDQNRSETWAWKIGSSLSRVGHASGSAPLARAGAEPRRGGSTPAQGAALGCCIHLRRALKGRLNPVRNAGDRLRATIGQTRGAVHRLNPSACSREVDH